MDLKGSIGCGCLMAPVLFFGGGWLLGKIVEIIQ